MPDIPERLQPFMLGYSPHRLATLRGGHSLGYRGFTVTRPVDGWKDDEHLLYQYEVEWKTYCNFWIPASFTFTGSPADLVNYLDGLLARNTLIQEVYERKHCVTNVVERKAPVRTEVVRISPERLAAVLLGIDPLEVSAGSNLEFYSTERSPLTKTIQATLVAAGYLPEMTAEQIGNVATRFSKFAPPLHSGRNLDPKKREEMVQYLEHPEEPVPKAPEEVPICTSKHEDYTESITMIMGERRYFVRRVIRYDGMPVFTGTSWSINGPWTVTAKDDIACAALGLEGAA